MAIRNEIKDVINAIKALSQQNGGGSDTKKIDSDDECRKLSELLARTDLELTQEEKDAILGLKIDYKATKLHQDEIAADVPVESSQGDKALSVEDGEMTVAAEDVNYALRGHTNDDDRDMVSGVLDSVNKDNVLAFLDGYYKDNKGRMSGLFKRLDKRGRSNRDSGESRITMEQKVKLLQTILEKAKEQGLDNTPEYITIKNILKKYTDDTGKVKSENTKFNKTNQRNKFFEYKHGKGLKSHLYSAGGAVAGWGVGALIAKGTITGTALAPGVGTIVGAVVGLAVGYFATRFLDHNTDNEILDDNIEALYEKMK